MSKDSTIEEIRKCKAEAEKKILEVMANLHEDTGCIVVGLHFDDEVVVRVGDNKHKQMFNIVDIELKV